MIKEIPNFQAMVDSVRNTYRESNIVIQDDDHSHDPRHQQYTHTVWLEEGTEEMTTLRNIGSARMNDCEAWCFFLTFGITLEGEVKLWACKKS